MDKLKKLFIGFVAILGFAVVSPAQAEDQKVVAVIDTAIDSSKNSSIIYEVCINSEYSTCNNGTKFQEGNGSANLSNWKISGIDHGFNVVQVYNLVSPNTKIVFIRTSEITPSNTLRLDARSLPLALDWVSKNASKYSIDAVSISQSSTGRTYTESTCPTNSLFESSALALANINIPTFTAVGNDGNKNQIGFPSCSKNVIPVASVNPNGDISSFSNFSSQVKLFANDCAKYNGNICVKAPDYAGVMRAQTGTSIATPLAVATLMNRFTGSWSDLIASLPKKGTVGQIK